MSTFGSNGSTDAQIESHPMFALLESVEGEGLGVIGRHPLKVTDPQGYCAHRGVRVEDVFVGHDGHGATPSRKLVVTSTIHGLVVDATFEYNRGHGALAQ